MSAHLPSLLLDHLDSRRIADAIRSPIMTVRPLSLIAIALLNFPSCAQQETTGDVSTNSKNTIQNVILISMDTTRWDVLSCYNAPEAQTPNIHAFARDNIVFDNCYSPVAVTLPAHATILTGLTPPQLGVLDNNSYFLAEHHVTLAEILRENGFQTAAFVSSFILNAMFGLDQGFDIYDDDVEKGLGIDERRGDQTTTQAIAWLERNRTKKNFLFIHYYDPHAPYEPPEPFASRFKELYREYPDYIQDYVGEIAFTDHCIEQFLSRLRALGLYHDSLICITADHGESHGEHKESTHGYFIYTSTTKVPLLFKVPGESGPIHVQDAVGLVDILPTICAAVGVETATNFAGRDLTKYFKGIDNLYPDRAIFSYSIHPRAYRGNPLLGLISHHHKYVHTTRPELYDLSVDVYEQVDVIERERDLARLMHGRLRDVLDQFPTEIAMGRLDLDVRTVQRLERLGYAHTTENAGLFELDSAASDPKELIEYHELNAIALSYINPEHFAEAQAAAKAMIEMRPDLFNGYVMMGKILISMGRRADAIPYLERAAGLDPDGTRAQLQAAPTPIPSS